VQVLLRQLAIIAYAHDDNDPCKEGFSSREPIIATHRHVHNEPKVDGAVRDCASNDHLRFIIASKLHGPAPEKTK
jgi:hypothetical protein